MNTGGPTISDLAGPGRKPQVLTATGSVATATLLPAVVAAPGAGKRIVVLGVCVTTNGAVGLVSLKNGSTVLWQAYVASPSPVPDNPANGQPVCVVTANTALDFRNDAAGTSTVNVRYIIEAVV
jgi:hypothetical protein